MRLDTSVSLERSVVSAAPSKASAAVQTTVGEGSAAAEPSENGIKVSLSVAGLARSNESEKNSDIDESDLPATIKQLLKLIRELKAQLAEKMAELQALMAQQGLDAETRQMRAQALQTEVGSLSGALSSANAQLVKVIREEGLSAEQSASIASLM